MVSDTDVALYNAEDSLIKARLQYGGDIGIASSKSYMGLDM